MVLPQYLILWWGPLSGISYGGGGAKTRYDTEARRREKATEAGEVGKLPTAAGLISILPVAVQD